MSWKEGCLVLLAASLLTFGLAGCHVLHDLKPHRWQRLNHGLEGMPSDDYNTFYRPSVDPSDAVLLAESGVERKDLIFI